MSTTNSDNVCPRCGIISTENGNRLVTDNCGHRKCRRCLLADDECMECYQNAKQSDNENNTISAEVSSNRTNACDSVETNEATNIDERKNNGISRKKGRKVVSMPLHIKRVEDATESDMHFYYCTKCCRKFTSRSQQYYHLKCGNDSEKKYKCRQCEKAFSTSSHLNYHLETHTANTYNCTYCQKAFTNRMVLRKHEKHHFTTSLQCSECHREFRSKYSLSAHISKMHDDKELPYKCTECEKSYTLKSTLKQHMQKHYDKKYVCKYCNKRFQRNYTLKLHLKKHTKTDCFLCGICFNKFSDAAVLLRHAKIHKDTIKYRCMECYVTIMRKDNMLRHIRTIHPERNFENCVEISQPSISSDHIVQNVIDTKNNMPITEPKTVENSAVIKCIGNVEPMKVPTCTFDTTTTATITIPSVAASTKIVPTDDAITSTKVTANTHYEVSAEGKHTTTSVQKKVKKKYDPIKMYRKILASDCEDESVYESDSEKDIDVIENSMAQNTANAVVNVVDMTPSVEKRLTLTTSNFSEMHWRKNFKYTYQYQDF